MTPTCNDPACGHTADEHSEIAGCLAPDCECMGLVLAVADSLPVLPYAYTSGHAPAESSRAAVVAQDQDGRTGDKQANTLEFLDAPWWRHNGTTWRELDARTGWGHGTTSRVLSVLHKTGKLARLQETRGNCAVYVLPEHVNGRPTSPHGRTPKGDLLSTEERRVVQEVRAWGRIYGTPVNLPEGTLRELVAIVDRLAPKP